MDEVEMEEIGPEVPDCTEVKVENEKDAADEAAVIENNAEEVHVPDFDPKTAQLNEPFRFAPKDLLALLRTIETDIFDCEATLKEENEKRRKHKIDDCRRVHDYDDFITTFLSMLAERGLLGDLLENALDSGGSGPSGVGSTAKKKGCGAGLSNGAGGEGNNGGGGPAAAQQLTSNGATAKQNIKNHKKGATGTKNSNKCRKGQKSLRGRPKKKRK